MYLKAKNSPHTTRIVDDWIKDSTKTNYFVQDPLTGETALEGGALVLADQV